MSISAMRNTFQKSGCVLKGIYWTLAIVFGLGMVVYFGPSIGGGGLGGGGGKAGSGVVLKVNGEAFKRSDLDSIFSNQVQDYQNRMAMQTGQRTETLTVPQMAAVRQRAVQLFTDTGKQVALAKSQGIRLSRREVRDEFDKELGQIMDQRRPGGSAGKPVSDKEWDAILKTQNTTLDAFREQLKRDLMNEDLVRYQLYIRKLADKLGGGPLNDKKIDDYYANVTARQIVISTQGKQKSQAEKRANEIYDKVKGGADFAAAAKQFSDDPMTKSNGGLIPNLTYQTAGQYMYPEVIQALYALKPGEVAKPVPTQMGYFIVKMEGSTPNRPADWAKKQKEYRTQIADSYKSVAFEVYYSGAKDKLKVELLSPELMAFDYLNKASEAYDKPAVMKEMTTKALKELDTAIADEARAMQKQGGSSGEVSSMQAVYYWMKASIYRQTADQKGEIAALEDALRFTDTPDMIQRLAALYTLTGQKDKALAQYRNLVPMMWDQPETLRQAAAELKKLGDEKTAAEALKMATEREAETKAQMEQQRQAQEEYMKQMVEEQKKKEAEKKAGGAKPTTPPGKPKPGGGG